MGYSFSDVVDTYMIRCIYINTMTDWRHKSIVLKRLEDYDERMKFINAIYEGGK